MAGRIISIVCVDSKWGIGKRNGLLFNLKEDMKFFRETTKGAVVACGYNTLLSFPCGQPLKGRTTLVLAPAIVERSDCEVFHSLDDMLSAIRHYTDDLDRDVFIIGGAMFYKATLQMCDMVLVNKVDADGGAEVFFEDMDANDEFEIAEQREPVDDCGYVTRLCTYARKGLR